MYDPYQHNDDDGKDHPDSIIEDRIAKKNVVRSRFRNALTREYTCSKCGELGHNRRTCTKP